MMSLQMNFIRGEISLMDNVHIRSYLWQIFDVKDVIEHSIMFTNDNDDGGQKCSECKEVH